MQRYGMLIKAKPEKLDEYKELHANPWPGELKTIHDCNIRNYSIYLKDGFLFGYYEYIGDDYAADMTKMAADPVTQEGGSTPTLARSRSQRAKRANGGRLWRKSFIAIDLASFVGGSMNSRHPPGSPTTCKQQAMGCLRLAQGSRYMLSAGCEVPAGASDEIFMGFCRAPEEYSGGRR